MSSGIKQSLDDIFKYVKYVTGKQILPVLFGVTMVLLFPIVFLLTLPLYFARFGVIILAKLFRPDLGEILNGMSNGLYRDILKHPIPRGNIVASMVLSKPVSEDDFRRCVWDSWIRGTDKINGQLLYPKFQQYPVKWLGYTFYKHAFDTFSLDNHIYFHKIETGKSVTERDVLDITEKLVNSPFKPKTSLWEIHVIHDYVDPKLSPDENMCVMIMKVHHSLTDGFSLLKAIIEGMCGYNLKNLPMPKVQIPKRTFWDKAWFLFKFPISIMYESVVGCSQFLLLSPWIVPDERKTWHQNIAKTKFIPLQTIYQIKKKFNVTFTSVIISAISAAAYKTLSNQKKRNLIQSDTKSIFTFSALPLPGHNETLTNHATGTFFNTPTIDFPSPLTRLKQCDTTLQRAKSSVIPSVISIFGSYAGSLIRPLSTNLAKNRSVSLALSNFPGFPVAIEICGRKCLAMDTMVGCVTGDGGAAVLVFRYQDQIRISVVAEKAIMSSEEVSNFVEYMTDEINILYADAVSKEK